MDARGSLSPIAPSGHFPLRGKQGRALRWERGGKSMKEENVWLWLIAAVTWLGTIWMLLRPLM